MYKLIIASIILAASFQTRAVNKSSQEAKTYYWFYVKVSKSHNKTTGISRVLIKSVSSDIRSGTIEQFTDSHKKALKSNKILIGPFSQDYQAQQAQKLYRYAARGSSGLAKTSEKEQEEPVYSFFYVKPLSLPSGGTLQRIPARVTTGTEAEYMAMLLEGLNFEKLAVGPFSKYESAELSKYACIKSSKMESDLETDSIKDVRLRMMAKKWKGLDRRITKKSESKEEKRVSFRFSIKIPSRYFAPDAVQVVTIKAGFSNANSSSYSFTLQGDNVIDNNRVASYDMGTYYIEVLDYHIEDKEKVESFVFEGFIYDDCKIIELEPAYIEIKQ